MGNPRELLLVVLEAHEVSPALGFSVRLPFYLSILHGRLQPRHQAIEAQRVLRALADNASHLADALDPEAGEEEEGAGGGGGAATSLREVPTMSAVAAAVGHQTAAAHHCLDALARTPEAAVQEPPHRNAEAPPCAHGSVHAPARVGAGARAKVRC